MDHFSRYFLIFRNFSCKFFSPPTTLRDLFKNAKIGTFWPIWGGSNCCELFQNITENILLLWGGPRQLTKFFETMEALFFAPNSSSRSVQNRRNQPRRRIIKKATPCELFGQIALFSHLFRSFLPCWCAQLGIGFCILLWQNLIGKYFYDILLTSRTGGKPDLVRAAQKRSYCWKFTIFAPVLSILKRPLVHGNFFNFGHIFTFGPNWQFVVKFGGILIFRVRWWTAYFRK